MPRALNFPTLESVKQESYKDHGPGCCMSMCSLYTQALTELYDFRRKMGYNESIDDLHSGIIGRCQAGEAKI